MSGVRINADELVGRTNVEPHIAVFIERQAVLDIGMEGVLEREVRGLRIEVGFKEPAVYKLPARHLNGLIDLFRQARDRVNDVAQDDDERADPQSSDAGPHPGADPAAVG